VDRRLRQREQRGAKIFQLQNNSWVLIPGDAEQISVSPDLGVPWLVTRSQQIYE